MLKAMAGVAVLVGGTVASAHQETPQAGDPPLDAEKAKNFVEQVNEAYYDRMPLLSSAYWLQSTYINDDSQRVASYLNERQLAWTSAVVKEAAKFNDVEVDDKTRRALRILKVGQTLPAPDDPDKRAELAKISSSLEAMYGAGKWCPEGAEEDSGDCKSLNDLEDVIDNSRDPEALLQAWKGWRTISPPMREKYARFVELGNEGAATLGFENLGELWRAGYDMSPAEFTNEVERLWGQVEPLYEELQCYVRGELESEYGSGHFGEDNLIPAHLLGNMWSQEWSNVYPLVQPYPGASNLDVKAAMEEKEWTPRDMVESAEGFYESLGLRSLPESFWKQSMFTKPEDRDVVCHASAWDMDMKGDVRIKMCIEVNEEDLTTIYHELGHLYYDLAYNALPPVFQSGAHDGFHEAIGDAVVLSMTPKYLAEVGLVEEAPDNEKALINEQMKTALDKIAFLPFGLLIDQWRWRVFSGDINPGEYNSAWWKLREQYQGIKAPEPRGEEHFDPGAKYHIPGNTPYTRYFLARILQFQFHRAMCEAAGHEGPLHECSVYENKEAGERFWAMMEKGQSQPWQETLAELTGKPEMDASAIIDYYQPLMAWLEEKNEGRQCGWAASGASVAVE
jgi:peptidyl-dipeptidase A